MNIETRKSRLRQMPFVKEIFFDSRCISNTTRGAQCKHRGLWSYRPVGERRFYGPYCYEHLYLKGFERSQRDYDRLLNWVIKRFKES